MAISGIPFQPVQSASGNQWNATRYGEKASQTFLAGTPVLVDANGFVIAGTGVATKVTGISYEAASNLGSDALGAPLPYQPIVGLGAAVGTFGSVPNQASAKNISHGAPFSDGRVGVIIAGPDTVFSGVLGTSVSPATPTVALIGTSGYLGLDSNSKFWYVSTNSATWSTANVTIVGLDPRDTPAAGTRVLFTFIQSMVNIPIF